MSHERRRKLASLQFGRSARCRPSGRAGCVCGIRDRPRRVRPRREKNRQRSRHRVRRGFLSKAYAGERADARSPQQIARSLMRHAMRESLGLNLQTNVVSSGRNISQRHAPGGPNGPKPDAVLLAKLQAARMAARQPLHPRVCVCDDRPRRGGQVDQRDRRGPCHGDRSTRGPRP